MVDAVVADKVMEPMARRWHDAGADYPGVMLPVLAVALDRAAVEWIDANKPRHWARAMFARQDPPGPAA